MSISDGKSSLTRHAGNLSSEKVTKRDIYHVFHAYGELAQISIKQAYGFVQFLRTEDCQRAMEAEQGTQIRDKRIRKSPLDRSSAERGWHANKKLHDQTSKSASHRRTAHKPISVARALQWILDVDDQVRMSTAMSQTREEATPIITDTDLEVNDHPRRDRTATDTKTDIAHARVRRAMVAAVAVAEGTGVRVRAVTWTTICHFQSAIQETSQMYKSS